MKDVRIALFHCPKSTTYKLLKMTAEMDENDPCILWVFDSSNMRIANKIMKNLNVANVVNTTSFAF